MHLNPDQEAQLEQLSAVTGRRTDELVREALDHMLAYNAWFKEQVRVGLDQLHRGEFIEDDEIRNRIERMFRS